MRYSEAFGADVVLAEVLEGVYEGLRVYGSGQRPNRGLGEGWVEIEYNGPVRRVTESGGMYRGHLLVTVYVRNRNDDTVRTERLRGVLAAVERAVDGVARGGFFFEPGVTVLGATDAGNGYGAMSLDVEWHTTDEFHNR